MKNTQAVTSDIWWVGGSDRRLALFENMFPLENGVTYNSFLIRDEKTALLDTVDAAVTRQFLENVTETLGERGLDYLVINHMEPDHCANIQAILGLYPNVQIVGNRKTFQLIEQFYPMDLTGKTLEVKEGDTLDLGRHTLRFYFAPMVHWPEVMFAYEEKEGILFSADAFGTFGGYTGNLFSDMCDYAQLYMEEARRYYTNIVGKFGAQVQAILKKVCTLPLNLICPLHGPVLRGAEMALLLEKYQRWSTYTPEASEVLIAYASMYGNTEHAVHDLAGRLSAKGVPNIRMYDVSKTHCSSIIAQVFRCSHLVVAAPTYNMGVYGAMETLLRDMKALNIQKRKVAILGNGSWAPQAPALMQKMVEEMKEMTLLAPPLVIHSALKPGQEEEMEHLAEAIATSVLAEGGQ